MDTRKRILAQRNAQNVRNEALLRVANYVNNKTRTNGSFLNVLSKLGSTSRALHQSTRPVMMAQVQRQISLRPREDPMAVAAELGAFPIVEDMLKNGRDPNIRPERHLDTVYMNSEQLMTPLQRAVKKKNLKIVKLLLQYGADPHVAYYGERPLALIAGDIKYSKTALVIAKMLLSVMESIREEKDRRQKLQRRR